MNNFSPNMLKTFDNCPIKFHFKYIDRISVPQKSSIFEKGKKVHALAHYYLRGDNIDKLEQALSSSEKQIWQNLKTNPYFQKTYVNSEYNLSCKVGSYWVGGRIDALMKELQDNNSFNYYILDYKTGTVPKNPEYDYQTMVYLLCADKLLQEYNNLKFIYIDLKNNENCIIDFTPEKKEEYENKLINICEQISNAQLPEEIEHSKICEFCEYRKICI